MHKHSQMLYDILKAYTEGMTVRCIGIYGWTSNHEFGPDKQVRNPTTKFNLTLAVPRLGVLNNIYHFPINLDFPEIIDVKYLYRALHELEKTHRVNNFLKEDEIYRALGIDNPPNVWELLEKDTDFEEFGI